MSAPDTTVFQFNFKIGNDLHNVYATNGGESIELLDFFEESLIPRLAAISQKATGSAHVASAGLLAPAAQQTVTAPPPAASTAPAGAGGEHLCDHGQPMKYIAPGVSKATGKPYKGFWACNQPREMQCKAKVSV